MPQQRIDRCFVPFWRNEYVPATVTLETSDTRRGSEAGQQSQHTPHPNTPVEGSVRDLAVLCAGELAG
eukprot:CAMPEP_0194487444 /NCGR_PEP_ID=MMETSP0253-20130528/7721_1 /TAXON_ID=2966 /ORGANISM="Noctiluca scintillans" /LENGTH=67 /DNA_ID=CAMNT_0039327663 /DNA_START=14 /DNA_END=214 /DNA_ORIENTATION=+